MWPESAEQPKPLRSGLTTGSCATACCVAAVQALLAKRRPEQVEITLPKGQQVSLPIVSYQEIENGMITATIKDAGDDPDVTHGATVFVELRLISDVGVRFKAAKGVGTVTREGLVLPVGEPAINPTPRKMITDHLTKTAYTYQYQGGFEVAVGVERGEQIALKTMNPRLGILGGLSILGTTGIVRPYSCSAYIASIKQGIDVAAHNGFSHIAATTGSSSEQAIAAHYQLPEIALIEMGDFVGAVLKHIRYKHIKHKKVEYKKTLETNHRKYEPGKSLSIVNIEKLSLCGGFGKLSKLAEGHLDLNSRVSAISFSSLAKLAAEAGGDKLLQQGITCCNTSIQALQLCQQANVDLASAVCKAAWQVAQGYLPTTCELEVWAVDRKGRFVGCYSSGPASISISASPIPVSTPRIIS